MINLASFAPTDYSPSFCSVAIMSDAAHMLSDVCGFGVSIFAAWAVARRSHHAYSFGYHRVEIIGALVSIMLIWLVTGMLVYEAVNRLINPVPVDGKSERPTSHGCLSDHHAASAACAIRCMCLKPLS